MHVYIQQDYTQHNDRDKLALYKNFEYFRCDLLLQIKMAEMVSKYTRVHYRHIPWLFNIIMHALYSSFLTLIEFLNLIEVLSSCRELGAA